MLRYLLFLFMPLIALTQSVAARDYLVENGQLISCVDGDVGFNYELQTEITQEPENGFVCAKSKSLAKKEIESHYINYEIKVLYLKVSYAVDIHGVGKTKRALEFT